MLVCCRECKDFIFDTIGNGFGIGECKSFADALKTNPSQSDIRLALLGRGNNPDVPIFWGGSLKDRRCKKFKPSST